MNLRHPGLRRGAEEHLALVALLLVQAGIGYLWLMSGITKVVRGGFASGLADELAEKSEAAPSWYRDFLDEAVIPNAELAGVLIMVAELLVGVALVGAAVVWLFEWSRLSDRARRRLLAAVSVALLAATVMAANFHFANGASHPWLVPEDGFDEGVDLDSLLPFMQLVLLCFSMTLHRRLGRSEPRAGVDPQPGARGEWPETGRPGGN